MVSTHRNDYSRITIIVSPSDYKCQKVGRVGHSVKLTSGFPRLLLLLSNSSIRGQLVLGGLPAPRIRNSSENPRGSGGIGLFAPHRDSRERCLRKWLGKGKWEKRGREDEAGRSVGESVDRSFVNECQTAKVFLWSPKGPKDFRD